MAANSAKIIFCVKLSNEQYQKLHQVALSSGETKASIARRALMNELTKLQKALNLPTRPAM